MSENTNTSKKALVLFSTMTGRTKKIALKIVEEFQKHNIMSQAIDINKTPREEVIEAINDAHAIFFGTSTKYADIIGDMEEVLTSLADLDLEDKLGAAFGSYRWNVRWFDTSDETLRQTNIKLLNTSDIIKSTGMIDVQLPIRVRFTPTDEDLRSIERAVLYTADLLLSSN